MKKYFIFGIITIALFVFSNCRSSRKVTADVPKLTYEHNVQTLIAAKCTPCHIPEKGGRKKDYTNFAAVQGDIDEIISRISLNPGEKGYMPLMGAKLSDSTIAIFTKWKADGLIEK